MTARKITDKWYVDFWFKYPNGSKERFRKQAPVNTKRGAETYERDLRLKLQSGEYQKEANEGKKRTVAEFAEVFIENHVKPNNKDSEILNKSNYLRLYIIPAFGERTLASLTTADVEAFKAKLLGDGLKKSSVNRVLNTLGKLLKVAVDWGDLEHTLKVARFSIAKTESERIKFLSSAEVSALLTELKDNTLIRDLVIFLLNTGLRIGEARALRWADVDMTNRKIIVKRNMWANIETSPKSGKSREIPINDAALAALKAQFHLKGPWVWCLEDGSPLTAHTGTTVLENASRRAGIQHTSFHVLRHTFASNLVMRNIPIRTVQDLLGHADITVTMRYAHLTPTAKVEAVAALCALGS